MDCPCQGRNGGPPVTLRQSVTVEAPAKINLGLEILGKRFDGFHEIRTVMVMLQLADTLRVFTGPPSGTELPEIPAETNLVTAALAAYRQAVPRSAELGWSIEKRIPVAAGLGGASSNAAAALLAANELSGNALSLEAMSELAGTLGSDVPFFLGGPTALASGRGTALESLPPVDQPVMLLVPGCTISEKTRTLYSMIIPDDMTDGSRSERVRRAVEHHTIPAEGDLANAFSRPLTILVPDVLGLHGALAACGVDRFGLSGAGPAHYVIGRDACKALSANAAADRRLDMFETITTRTRMTPLVARSSTSSA